MLSRGVLVIAVSVLAVTSLAVESPAASAKKQCIKQTCRAEKKSCTAAFKGQFGTSKATCTELKGKARRQCKKAAKGTFKQNRNRCKVAFRDCKKCCKGDQITACSVAVCGDGIKEAGEECDGPDDSACSGRCQEDCACLVTSTTTSTTTTTTLRSGRFVDFGDGTIRDESTGLQWEKKDSADGTANPANLHDVDNLYTWAGYCMPLSKEEDQTYCQPNAAAAAACSAHTGGAVGCSECSAVTCYVDPYGSGAVTTIWDWLVQMNAEGFAGYRDWRIPEVAWFGFGRAEELESILRGSSYPCSPQPCIDPIFGPLGENPNYWSGSGNPRLPHTAIHVNFRSGGFGNRKKDFYCLVRAVRGGS